MKALQLQSYAGPKALTEVELADPERGSDEVLIDVKAIGINYPDVLISRGEYQRKPETPFVPGCEIAGVVREASDSAPWQPKDRVAAFIWEGGYAERAVAPQRSIVRVSDRIELTTAVALLMNYHTTYFALKHRGGLQEGDRLLVLGAAGGVGSAAVQVGKGLGARVIAGVADDRQFEAATGAGADEVLVLERDFGQRVRELTSGDGVDIVLDPLGDWLFGEAVRALAPFGRILVVGFAAGEIPALRVNRLLLRNASAVGVAWGAHLERDEELMASTGRALERMMEAGLLRPSIDGPHGFDEIPGLLDRLAQGEIRGKAVVDLEAQSSGVAGASERVEGSEGGVR